MGRNYNTFCRLPCNVVYAAASRDQRAPIRARRGVWIATTPMCLVSAGRSRPGSTSRVEDRRSPATRRSELTTRFWARSDAAFAVCTSICHCVTLAVCLDLSGCLAVCLSVFLCAVARCILICLKRCLHCDTCTPYMHVVFSVFETTHMYDVHVR